MKNKDVKTNLLDHSQAKVRLLSEYLIRYLSVICNDKYTKEIDIYDLFCGEGEYENGGEGSPLVIMRAIKDVHFVNFQRSGYVPKINCFFNDLDSEKVEKTNNAITKKSLYYERFGSIEFSWKDYKDYLILLQKKLRFVKNKKVFIFIDPYEYKHIKISQIKQLIANKNTEVLLWLPTQFMYRFESNGTPIALTDFIEEIVPYEHWKRSDNVWKFVDQLKDSFQDEIGEENYVDHFTIQKDRNTVFCLFFFTPHIKGFEKILEAKWKIDTEQGKGWYFSGNQPSLFHQQKTNPLERKLIDFLNSGPKTNGELYKFSLKQRFLPKHLNEILYHWQQNNQLDVKLHNGQNARKGAFYISYKYFNNDFNKVFFTLK